MAKNEEKDMNKDEQIGFHKGSLATLAKERQELARILNIVEQLMQMHVKGLQDLGVDLTKETVEGANDQPKKAHQKPKVPIEDVL